jgi:hypothetical protein
MIEVIKTGLERDCNIYNNPFGRRNERSPIIENFSKLSKMNSSACMTISPEKYTKKQKAFSKIIEKVNIFAHNVVCKNENLIWNSEIERDLPFRTSVLGISKQADAWTDASSFIAINSDTLQNMIEKDGVRPSKTKH